MNMKIVLILSLLLASCAALKQAKPIDDQIYLSNENLSQLNGEYEVSSQDPDKASLDLSLLFKKYWYRDPGNISHYKISLKAVDKQQLQVNVFKNDTLIDSKNIHYKIKNGSLIFKRKKIIPYVALNVFGSMATRLRLINTGDLNIDHSNYQVATLIVIPIGGDGVDDYGVVFKKRNSGR